MIEATKTIEWSILGAPAAGAKGTFDWNLLAGAHDAHVNRIIPEIGTGTCPIAAGFGPVAKTTGLAGSAGHPTAQADIDFAATPLIPAGGPINQVTGTIHVKAQADVVPDPAGIHGNQSARAASMGSMTINGGTVTGATLAQPGQKIKVLPTSTFTNGTVPLTGDTAGRGSFHDPLSLGFFDLRDGTLINEDLLSFDMFGDGDTSWAWASSGISIHVPFGGAAFPVILTVLSSWITDPTLVNSTISFTNGVFHATGIFQNMPWTVTPTNASLSAGAFNSLTIPYQVPASLLNSSHLYSTSLNFDQGVQIEASAAVPEPASLGLFLVGTAILVGRHRRARQGV